MLAQADAVTEAKVKAWLKEKQRSFYGERAKDPSIQALLAQYNRFTDNDLFCTPPTIPHTLDVKAVRTGEETVRVHWEASTDQTVTGYILERSFQKEGPYERVYYQNPTSAGPVQAYQFTDHNTFEEQSYYRVVQVLATGQQKAQKAVAQGYKTVLSIQAYPNPSVDRFRLSVQSKKETPVQIRVVDVLGRVVETRNNLPANHFLEIGELYPAGLYLVQVVQGPRTRQLLLQKGSRAVH